MGVILQTLMPILSKLHYTAAFTNNSMSCHHGMRPLSIQIIYKARFILHITKKCAPTLGKVCWICLSELEPASSTRKLIEYFQYRGKQIRVRWGQMGLKCEWAMKLAENSTCFPSCEASSNGRAIIAIACPRIGCPSSNYMQGFLVLLQLHSLSA